MKPNEVPTEEDWGDDQDEDVQYARELFGGKTQDEVLHYFEENPIDRADELQRIPATPFRYYMMAYCKYITNPEAVTKDPYDYKSDAASCFLSTVIYKLEHQAPDIMPILPQLMPTIEYVASHQELFEAPESIYGNFPEKLEEIRRLAGKA